MTDQFTNSPDSPIHRSRDQPAMPVQAVRGRRPRRSPWIGRIWPITKLPIAARFR